MDKPSKHIFGNKYYLDLLISALEFIRGLLENVGTDIEPLRLIKSIPDGLEIPGLKDALLKILQDYNLQVDAIPILYNRQLYNIERYRCRYMKVVKRFLLATAFFSRIGCTGTRSEASIVTVSVHTRWSHISNYAHMSRTKHRGYGLQHLWGNGLRRQRHGRFPKYYPILLQACISRKMPAGKGHFRLGVCSNDYYNHNPSRQRSK